VNKEVCAGTDATFTVGATGKKLFYHWKKGTELLEKFFQVCWNEFQYSLPLKAATTADAGQYSCTIVDGCGGTLNTIQVTLSITTTPVISSQPKDVSDCPGTTAVFQIATTDGKNVTYQWKKGNLILAPTANITGTQTNKLTIVSISAADAGDYTCEVSGACLSTPVVSQKAVLSVKSPYDNFGPTRKCKLLVLVRR
jgi:hypothetical protein